MPTYSSFIGIFFKQNTCKASYASSNKAGGGGGQTLPYMVKNEEEQAASGNKGKGGRQDITIYGQKNDN
jgi:hypothetical protein